MIATGLTARRIRLERGGSAVPYPWGDGEVLVRDDAETALLCIGVLRDPGMPDAEKQAEFLPRFFADWEDAYAACDYDRRDFGRLVDAAVWDVYGVDLSGERACEAPLWDPAEDAAAIRVSLRMAYGIDWDEERGRIGFAEFAALVAGCPIDTPIGRAIHYRNPKTRPKATKHNKGEVAEWERLHRALALGRGRGPRGAADRSDAAMRDAFAALRRAAR